MEPEYAYNRDLEQLRTEMLTLERRQESFDAWKYTVSTERAAEAERMKSIDKELAELNSDIKEMNGNVRKILFIVAGVVITAVVRWVLDGNLGGI
jgi:septal ring factor EnvC (AmiA/AmiB activator)